MFIKIFFSRLLVFLSIVIGVSSFHGVFAATDYPDRPIRVIVPFLAGGSADAVIRIIADELGSRLGQSIVVENHAGAGGVVGATLVAQSKADGYTLLFTPPGPLTTNDFVMKLSYDAQTAFSPISLVTISPNVLLTSSNSKLDSLEKIISITRLKPGSLTYGSQGVGTTGHLTGEFFNKITGGVMRHIPYKGFPPALVDVIGGRVDLMFVDSVNALPQILSGKLKPIAVASAVRMELLSDLPTFREKGYSDFITNAWFAMVAPAGTPAEIRNLIQNKIQETIKVPEIRRKITALGAEAIGSTPEELSSFIEKEYKQWGNLITELGLSIK